jgi:hypothetical protein
MKRTYRFVRSTRMVSCRLPSGEQVEIPVIPGILKHPPPEVLPEILARPAAMEKYTEEALRKAAWPILAEFPRSWLRECLTRTRMKPSRRRALDFLLS